MNREAIRDLIGEAQDAISMARGEVCEDCEDNVLMFLQDAEGKLDELLMALDEQRHGLPPTADVGGGLQVATVSLADWFGIGPDEEMRLDEKGIEAAR